MPVAFAAVSCVRTGATVTVTGTDLDDELFFAEAESGVFTLNDVACTGAPTSTTTDLLTMSGGAGDDLLAIDLFGLPLMPGATTETPSSASEIEVSIDGGPGIDPFMVLFERGVGLVGGANGLNVNNDGDVDLTWGGVEEFWFDGSMSRSDFVASMQGDSVTGGPVSIPTVLIASETEVSAIAGGSADDLLVGAARVQSSMFGGDGFDTLMMEVPIHLQIRDHDFVQSTKVSPYSTGGSLSGIEEAIIKGTGPSLGLWSIFRGDMTVLGTSGADDIQTGPGNDEIDGFGGNDKIIAKAGNDILRGGAGDDLLQGGYGSDRFSGGLGTDRIVESVDGNLTLSSTRLTGALGSDTISSIERAFLTGGASNNILRGEQYRGRLTLRGGGGNDYLAGGYGADALYGDAGTDRLFGYASGDRLDGGTATDRCDGGVHTDRFVRCEAMLGRP